MKGHSGYRHDVYLIVPTTRNYQCCQFLFFQSASGIFSEWSSTFFREPFDDNFLMKDPHYTFLIGKRHLHTSRCLCSILYFNREKLMTSMLCGKNGGVRNHPPRFFIGYSIKNYPRVGPHSAILPVIETSLIDLLCVCSYSCPKKKKRPTIPTPITWSPWGWIIDPKNQVKSETGEVDFQQPRSTNARRFKLNFQQPRPAYTTRFKLNFQHPRSAVTTGLNNLFKRKWYLFLEAWTRKLSQIYVSVVHMHWNTKIIEGKFPRNIR